MDKLTEALKVITWLDEKRWQLPENYNLLNYSHSDLTPEEKILTHWITYITDRQMPFGIIWNKGGFVFSDMVWEYTRNKQEVNEIIRLFYKKKDKKSHRKEKYVFESLVKGNNGLPVQFASRFITMDVKNIEKTLILLDDYNRSLVKFVCSVIDRFGEKDDLLRRIACALDISTYSIGRKEDLYENVKRSREKLTEGFDDFYKVWNKKATIGKKRMWCSLRDYTKKGSHFFQEFLVALEKYGRSYVKTWEQLSTPEKMSQLELPGDVWNENSIFREKLVYNILKEIPLEVKKSWNSSQLVRRIYNHYLKGGVPPPFYPEQFDITFDFVPRMCVKQLCKVCPFGKEGSLAICSGGNTEYCPVALVTCGYIVKCNPQNCIIKEGVGKGSCLEVT